MCPECGHWQKIRIKKNLAGLSKGSQSRHPFPILYATVNFGSCPVSKVRGMMTEFQSRMTRMWAERHPDCLILGEFELAPTLIYGDGCVYTGKDQEFDSSMQTNTLGASHGDLGILLIPPPVPVRWGVIVHGHFNALPYCEKLRPETLREIIQSEFGRNVTHEVKRVRDQILRGRMRDGIEQTMEYALDKSHGGAKRLSRQPYDEIDNPDGLPDEAWMALINGYSSLMGGRAKRLPLVHNLGKQGVRDCYALRPPKTRNRFRILICES